MPVTADVRSTLDQDVWWQDIHGIYHLIDNMNPSWRANCAALLVKQAAIYHLRKRRLEIVGNWWSFSEYAADKDWGPINEDGPPTFVEIRETVRKEQDRGEHLDWVRSTPLFRRLIQGIEDLLPPGTLGGETTAQPEPYGGDW